MVDNSWDPNAAAASFGTDSPGVANASPDALGLGSAQLQAVAALATPASFGYEAMQPAVSALSTVSSPTIQGTLSTHSTFSSPTIQSGPTKLFVGSIPPGTTQEMIKGEFGKIGDIAEIFLKSDYADPSRLWGFVTFVSPQAAATAVASFNERLVFPNAQRPLAVSFARSNTGGSGMNSSGGSDMVQSAAAGGIGPTKLFVGSIPAGTTREQINTEFGRFGQVVDIFLKNDNAEPGRMWGFVTYNNSSSAAAAVTNFHERLVLPGGARPCAVSFAKNSQAQHSMAAQHLATAVVNPTLGGTKLFIGTIPKGTTEAALRVEFERFGQVTEIFLKDDATDPQRMWGFLSYSDAQSAAVAVTTLHEKLMLPGSIRPLAVSFAKNSGRGPPAQQAAAQPMLALGGPTVVPPPPPGVTGGCPWKVYYTAQGLPYYHNPLTNTTQWECPPEYPGGPVPALPDTSNSSAAAGGAQQMQLGLGQGSVNVQANAEPAVGYSSMSHAGDTQRYSPF